MVQNISGRFHTREDAEQAMRDLSASGVSREAMHLTRIAAGAGRSTTADPVLADIIVGVVFGGLLGGTIGVFTGALFMSIPVLGALILSVMAGVGLGGSFAGMAMGVVSGLILGGLLGGIVWSGISSGDVVVTAEVEEDDSALVATIFRYDGALAA
ncbi:hypothetical protein K2Z83_17680 [Oscillochloris sp. ZM17-4]|uniref:hypothetical protein n=1 Tax=Oscillochloris sp. ZM17-4 TaxID=2866714 RepID=UPI001C735F3E|nr:hypothetical protein [Oscillochloris sp. ZM17-4]MBX0329504.1 hypothetical protein [Oscillochloris sp. ZM17-4]